MAGIVYPADAVTGAPSYTGRMLRNASVGPQAGGATSARPLGGFSGVRAGTANPCSATSTTWTVTPFAGTLDGEAAAIAGVYNYAFNTNQTGAVTAAAGSARVDRLDVQVSDPAEGDGTGAPAINVVYSAGVPGAGVPVAAPARSHLLCYINVPASGGGSPTITYNAPFTVAAGGILPVASSASYPASPYVGQVVDDAALGYPVRWNGTAWAPIGQGAWTNYTPTLANMVIGTGGTANGTLQWRYEGDQVHVRGSLILGTTGSSMGTAPTLTPPVPAQAITVPYQWLNGVLSLYDISALSTASPGVVRFNNGNTTICMLVSASANITASVPQVWAAGDIIYVDFIYDPA